MEFIGKLLSQGPLRETTWVSPSNETKMIVSVELKVTDGTDTIVGEVSGDAARALAATPFPQNSIVKLCCRLSVGEKDGKQWNRIRVWDYAKV